MKRPLLLLSSLTLALSGVAALLSKPDTKPVSASASDGKHLFIQVEQESDLHVGDTVFLATLGGTVLSSLSGNAVFASETHLSGRSDDGKKYYTPYSETYCDMLLMQVEKGAYNNTWSFKSIRSSVQEENYSHPTRGRYLAYGHEYSDKNYHNIQAYGDVNFADGKGQYTSWTVEFRGDDHYAIMKYHGEQYDTHIEWKYYGSTARNNFGYYTGATDICIFKEITTDQNRVELNIFRHPDQTTVYENDYLDLTGLEMSVTIDKDTDAEFTYTSTYEVDFPLYTVSFAAKGQTHVWCTFAGMNFNIEVEIIEDTSQYIYFNELKTQKGDYRATYLVVHQSETHITQLKADGWFIEYNKTTADGPIHHKMDETDSIMPNRFFIAHVRIDDTTYMFLQSGKNNKYVIRDGNSLDFSYTANIESAVTIDENLNIHIGDGILYFTGGDFQVASNPSQESRAKLYKRVVDFTEINSENTVHYSDFISSFASTTSSNCDVSGDTDTTLTTTMWNNLKAKFDDIVNDICGYDFQGYLSNTTYIHNEEKGTNSVKDLMDRYDFILSKYQKKKGFDDFIDRKFSEAYQDNYNPHTNAYIFNNNEIEEESSMIVIVIVSAISFASLVTLLILKKKRK